MHMIFIATRVGQERNQKARKVNSQMSVQMVCDVLAENGKAKQINGGAPGRTLDPLIKSQQVLLKYYKCLKAHKALPTTSTSSSATSSTACFGLSEIILTLDGCAARSGCRRRILTLSNESRMA